MKVNQKYSRRKGIIIIGLSWFILIYAGVTRNARLSQLGMEVMPNSTYQYVPNIWNIAQKKNQYRFKKIVKNIFADNVEKGSNRIQK